MFEITTRQLLLLFASTLLAGLPLVSPRFAVAAAPQVVAQSVDLKARMVSVTAPLETAIAALKVARVPEARGAFKEFERAWNRVENDVEKRSNDGHRSIENQSQQVERLLIKTANPDRPQTVFALEQLLRTINATTAKL